MTSTVGFIGAGQLGVPMVERLLGAGHDVLVYARREEVCRRLEAQGAAMAASVADLARGSDFLISCLFSDKQLRETGLGAGGFIANARPGSVFVSHTTGTLSTLEALRNGSPTAPIILDAPVSGTADDINAGTLTVLVGGPSETVAAVTPILAAYADPVVATGTLGSALSLKLINNLLFAANAQLPEGKGGDALAPPAGRACSGCCANAQNWARHPTRCTRGHGPHHQRRTRPTS
jgi:3-hydroxyisobutyrate dehydrogenase-like beta-hydroxyacid dehydrogenase